MVHGSQSKLMSSIFSEDYIGEWELQGLLAPKPTVQQVIVATPTEPESTVPLFSQVYEEFLSLRLTKINYLRKCSNGYITDALDEMLYQK